MDRLKHLGMVLVLIISLFLIFSQVAYASIDAGTSNQATYTYYIGPGLGNLIAQILIGLAIGGAAMAGIYRVRVINFLTNLLTRRRHGEESEESEESE